MKFLERHKILFVSLTISCVLSLILILFNGIIIDYKPGDQNTPYEIIKLISSVSGTILGFLLTAVAMLTAVMDRTLVENMRRTGHYRVFVVDCFVNCLVFLFVIVLGVGTLLLSNPYLSYMFYLICFLFLTAVAMLFKQGKRFLLIFTRI